MLTNSLKVNDDKTEFLIIGTPQQLAKIDVNSLRIGNSSVTSATSVRNLGVQFDPNLKMDLHINKLSSKCFAALYKLYSIRKYLSRDACETLAHAFVTSTLDYSNRLLHGLPEYKINKLQHVQNAQQD